MLQSEDLECITTADGSRLCFITNYMSPTNQNRAQQESIIFFKGTKIQNILMMNILGWVLVIAYFTILLLARTNVTLHYEALEWDPIIRFYRGCSILHQHSRQHRLFWNRSLKTKTKSVQTCIVGDTSFFL